MSDRLPEATFEQTCIDTIRFLAVDAVQRANSGHPGMPMGMAPVAHVLFTRHLKHDPADPAWRDRDRFVLSAGHGSMLLYSLLHLTGYGLAIDDLKELPPVGEHHARTPGARPDAGCRDDHRPTGPGLRQRRRHGDRRGVPRRRRFNRPATRGLVDHLHLRDRRRRRPHGGRRLRGVLARRTSGSGQAHRALRRQPHPHRRHHRPRLHRRRGADASTPTAGTRSASPTPTTSTASTRPSAPRGPRRLDRLADRGALAHRLRVPQPPGHVEGTRRAARRRRGPADEGGARVAARARVPRPRRRAGLLQAGGRAGRGGAAAWASANRRWRAAAPDLAETWDRAWRREPAPGWEAALPELRRRRQRRGDHARRLRRRDQRRGAVPADADRRFGRPGAFQQHADRGERQLPDGPTARRATCTSAYASTPWPRSANGMALHGGVLPYVATFFVFTDYMRPAVAPRGAHGRAGHLRPHARLASGSAKTAPRISRSNIWPRCARMPNLTALRPADANETVEAWKVALAATDGPVALALTRQKLPTLDRGRYAAADGVARGAYVLDRRAPGETPDLILLATGSEVHPALEAAADAARRRRGRARRRLARRELFDAQDAAYRESVLPASVSARLAVEAGVSFGWRDIVGRDGDVVGLDRFGASAPARRTVRPLRLRCSRRLRAGARAARRGLTRRVTRRRAGTSKERARAGAGREGYRDDETGAEVNRLPCAHEQGQSIWLDQISREMLALGELEALVAEGVARVTTNPSIFEKAVAGGDGLRRADPRRWPQTALGHAASSTGSCSPTSRPPATCSDRSTTRPTAATASSRSRCSPALAYDSEATAAEARATVAGGRAAQRR